VPSVSALAINPSNSMFSMPEPTTRRWPWYRAFKIDGEADTGQPGEALLKES
jgi:hypothetical protein